MGRLVRIAMKARPKQMEEPAMTDLPHEIQVWRSMDTLDHIGTWATTRYPAEAVTYVPKADAQAAVALARAEKAEQERDRIDQWRETAIVERDTYSEERDAAEADRDRLAADLAAAKQREAELLAALEDPLVVHLNMVAGKIAKPLPSQLAHIYGEDVIRAALASAPPADTLTTTQAAGQTDGHECLRRSHVSRADGVPADAVGNGNCLPLEGGPEAPEAQDELTRLRELIRKAYHALNPDRPTGLLANRLLERTRYLLKAEVRAHFPGEVDRG
jgi:hypothetical protein